MIGTSISHSLARWFRGPRIVAGLILLLLTAALTAGLTIWSAWNPTGNTSDLPAALVNEDVPAAAGGGPTLESGKELAQYMVQSAALQWTETTMDDAQEGLDSGRFAVVFRIPSDFSAKVASLRTEQPQQASIDAYTNDATNYLAGDLAADAMVSVEKAVGARLSLGFVDTVYGALPQAKKQGETAVTGAKGVNESAKQAQAQSATTTQQTAQVAASIEAAAKAGTEAVTAGRVLPQEVSAIAASIQDLTTSVTAMSNGAKAIDSNLATLQQQLTANGEPELAAQLAAIRTNYNTVVLSPMAQTATKGASVGTAMKKLDTDIQAYSTKATAAQSATAGVVTPAQDAARSAAAVQNTLDTQVVPQSTALAQGLTAAAAQVPPISDAQRSTFTKVLAQPIDVVNQRQNPVQYMGEGFAPLYIPVGLFVGAVALFLFMAPISRRLLDFGFAPIKATLSGWVPPFVLAIAQVALVALVVLLLGMKVAAWLPFIGILLLSAACFLAIVQVLKAAFGPGGVVVAVLLFILQTTAAAGTFPVQSLQQIFVWLHPFMPMTYAVDGLRRSMAGGPLTPYLWTDAAVLLGVTVVCIAITTIVAGKQRRLNAARLQPTLVFDS
ncbi:MAG: YhgE/Pip family protein [Candidatus Nanopelagicales bacterium]